MIEDALACVLQDLRKRHGLSEEKLAELTDTHRTYISQLERGLRSPSLRTLASLADALQISLRDLMGLVEEERSARAKAGREKPRRRKAE